MHTSLLVSHDGAKVMVDCGEDWLARLHRIGVRAIFITHAHPDHAWGLRRGAPCPVYATETAWQGMRRFGIHPRDRKVIEERSPLSVAGIRFEAVTVEHSLRAPAVGYRIGAEGFRLFYVPDVLSIPDLATTLRGVRLYVGDGASIVRPIVRTRGHTRIGHASIRTQLEWCAQAHIRRAIFTHCGTGIVGADVRAASAKVRCMGAEHGVDAKIAYDGMKMLVGARGR